MKNIFLFIFFFAFSSFCFAEQIYTYTDKAGNTVISNTPVPDQYQHKAKKIEAYERDDPREIERFQRKQKIAENKASVVQKQQQKPPKMSQEEIAKTQIQAGNHTTIDTSGWTDTKHPSGWKKDKKGNWELNLSGNK